MNERVVVRVPATSANLGPGFDSLGLALALTEDIEITLGPEGAKPHPLTQLVATAVRSAFREVGRPRPKELSVVGNGRSHIPVARGLGASAAGRAAGLLAANALMGEALSPDELLTLGAQLEGHADNMAPALFGGLQIVVRDHDRWQRLAVPLPRDLKVVLFVPDFEMPTREGRQRLPKRLARDDAVFNIGRAALLVAALAQGRWELLDAATQDRIHQPVRSEIFTALPDIFAAAKEAGAHAAYLSGSGSTVAALATSNAERIARLMQQAAIARGYSGRSMITEPSDEGARVV